jgi:argininosuccinate lyase
MPQKRNPYSLTIVGGASGVVIGRLAGFLAVAKSPSARSDNLIFAYGEVPRALDLCLRITRLITGVVRTMRVNAERMAEELCAGYTQSTDLAEHLVQACGVDYRTAYVVGGTVRAASRAGIPGMKITGEMIDEAVREHTGQSWALAGVDLSEVLDPWQIVLSRQAQGGAAPATLRRMTLRCGRSQRRGGAAAGLRRAAARRGVHGGAGRARGGGPHPAALRSGDQLRAGV